MMEKTVFIEKVRETWLAYEAALTALDETRLLKPRTCGAWSVRDVVAHVMWYEREMVGLIKGRDLIGSNLWNFPLEERNDAIKVELKGTPWVELSQAYLQVHRTLMEALETLSQDDLHEASRFRGMPPDWLPHEVIASNTYEHYPEHTRAIRAAFPQVNERDKS